MPAKPQIPGDKSQINTSNDLHVRPTHYLNPHHRSAYLLHNQPKKNKMTTCIKCARDVMSTEKCICMASTPLNVPFVADKAVFPRFHIALSHQPKKRKK